MIHKTEKIIGNLSQMSLQEEIMKLSQGVENIEVKNTPFYYEDYWVKPHILVDKLSILKGQVDLLSTLLLSDKVKQEVKSKRKTNEAPKQSHIDEGKEEVNQLTAEKNRLESYLKV